MIIYIEKCAFLTGRKDLFLHKYLFLVDNHKKKNIIRKFTIMRIWSINIFTLDIYKSNGRIEHGNIALYTHTYV